VLFIGVDLPTADLVPDRPVAPLVEKVQASGGGAMWEVPEPSHG
jgi:hypothetical protein